MSTRQDYEDDLRERAIAATNRLAAAFERVAGANERSAVAQEKQAGALPVKEEVKP